MIAAMAWLALPAKVSNRFRPGLTAKGDRLGLTGTAPRLGCKA